MAHPGAAAAANKAFLLQMKEKRAAAPVPSATAAPAQKSEKDLERERQREEEKARLKEELRQMREKEEREVQEKAAAAAAAAAAATTAAAAAPVEATPAPAPASAPAPVAPPTLNDEGRVASAASKVEGLSVSQPAAGTIRLRATVDHEAAGPGELSYKKGDIIIAPPGTDTKAASCKGVLHGVAGTIALGNTEDPATGKPNGPPKARTGVRCRAIGNYTAQAPDELSFKQGDVIFVTVCTPQPIWTGVFKGQVGKFPRRLVVDESGDPDSFPPPAASAAPAKFTKYVCVKPYNAKNAKELSITFGDSIQVMNDTGEDYLQGACNGSFGLFPVDHAVNSAEYTKQQIAQMIELEKKKAPKGGWVTFDAATPAPAASPATNDPFAPQPLSSATRGGDPFSAAADPFAPQPSSAVRAADPFAPQPSTGFAPSPMGFGPSVPVAHAAPHYNSPLPPVSAAAVQRALAESAPVLLTPPSPPRVRAQGASRRERDTSNPSSTGGSGPASGQGSLTMIRSTPASGEDASVSTPIGPLSSD